MKKMLGFNVNGYVIKKIYHLGQNTKELKNDNGKEQGKSIRTNTKCENKRSHEEPQIYI